MDLPMASTMDPRRLSPPVKSRGRVRPDHFGWGRLPSLFGREDHRVSTRPRIMLRTFLDGAFRLGATASQAARPRNRSHRMQGAIVGQTLMKPWSGPALALADPTEGDRLPDRRSWLLPTLSFP